MYADSLARGQLLYRDVVYWFGPFTPYFQSIFLRVFGSSFVSLVISGIVGSLGTLAALYWALRRVSGRREAFLWTALAIPVLIFMPNSGGAILGMDTEAGIRPPFRCWPWRAPQDRSALGRAGAVLVGTLCALAGLSRTEWGLMALAGAVVAFALSRDGPLAVASQRGARRRRRRPRVLGGGGAVRRARGEASRPGRREHPVDGRVAGDPPVPCGVLPRHPGMASRVGRARVLGGGLSAAILLCVWIALRPRGPKVERVPGRARRDRRRGGDRRSRGRRRQCRVLQRGSAGLFPRPGRRSRCRGRPRAAALGGFGLLGLLAAHRRPFHIGDTPYVAPQLLFAFCCLAGLLHVLTLTVARKGPHERRRLMRVARTALSLLLVAAFAARMFQYASAERTWIPGTGRMLSASEQTARDIAATAEAVRAAGPRRLDARRFSGGSGPELPGGEAQPSPSEAVHPGLSPGVERTAAARRPPTDASRRDRPVAASDRGVRRRRVRHRLRPRRPRLDRAELCGLADPFESWTGAPLSSKPGSAESGCPGCFTLSR